MFRLSVIFTIVLLVSPFEAHAQTEGWRVSQLTLYGWVPSISGAQEYPDGNPVVDLDSADVLDSLDFAFFGSAEVRNGPIGLVFDLAYADLGQDGQARGAIIPGADPASASMDTKLVMATAAVAYRFFDDRRSWVDVYGGFRFTDVSADVSFGIPALGLERTRSASVDWIDGIVGLRGHAPIGGRLAFTGLADAGGFDIGSSSKLTWQVQGTLDYAFTDRVIGRLGYRYMSIDYAGSNLSMDVDIHGPIIGLTWKF